MSNKITRYKNGMVIERMSNGWIIITLSGSYGIMERYLYYTQREAIKKFRVKYNI